MNWEVMDWIHLALVESSENGNELSVFITAGKFLE
jgi:hypothetical protein